jgi:hypothetical protein
MKTTFRQGDCMLIAIDEIPTAATAVEPRKDNRLVLLEGEATGHFHQFMDAQDVRMYVAHGGARYLDVGALTALTHDEHSTVDVPKGKYFIPVQVEYTPAELVRVAD